jgi:hypothetical protein
MFTHTHRAAACFRIPKGDRENPALGMTATISEIVKVKLNTHRASPTHCCAGLAQAKWN